MSNQPFTVLKAGGIVVQHKTKMIAVVVNEFNMTVLPKGGIEPDESLIQAAQREVLEETGLTDLELQGKLGIVARQGHSSAKSEQLVTIKEIHFFLFITNESILSPAAQESVNSLWLTLDQAITTLSYIEEANFIRKNRQHIVESVR